MVLSINYQIVPMILSGLIIAFLIGFLLIPFIKAVIMRQMGWAPLRQSFKHAFWINFLLAPIIWWSLQRPFSMQFLMPIYFSNSQVFSINLLSVLIPAILLITIEGLILAVLNKSNPYRWAWFLAVITNIPTIILLLVASIEE